MFFKYIISHVKLIIFNICFIGTLLTVFILYRLPVTSIGYSALLCSFIAIIFITADFNNLGNISGFMVVYGIWLTVVLVYSFIIWILNFETVSYMMRGCSKIVFQFIMILNIFAAAYLFGEKGIHYMFWGLALGNLAIALVLVPRYPISEIVSSVTVFLTQGGTAEGLSLIHI